MSCFKDKVILVTGASSGIGAATAILFAAKGAKVSMVGRNEAKLSNVVNHFTKKGLAKPLVIKADILRDDEAASVVHKTVEAFGNIDVLVNNAGLIKFGSILDGNVMKAYDEVMAVNVRAQIYITSLAAPYLIKSKGSIINISSVGARTIPLTPAIGQYNISKAALNQFTRVAAAELAPHGVRVISVSPGPVKTDILDNSGATFSIDDVKTALGRVSEPAEVAKLIMYLASDEAIAVTGVDYIIDNGYLLATN